MHNENFRIGFIMSSIPLVNHASRIARKENLDFMVSSKGLEEAVPVGREMENSGVEVIVSRGGTAYLLRENLHIPVLSIPLTSLDVLNSIKEAASLGRSAGARLMTTRV